MHGVRGVYRSKKIFSSVYSGVYQAPLIKSSQMPRLEITLYLSYNAIIVISRLPPCAFARIQQCNAGSCPNKPSAHHTH
jgi:hypothetical protein